MKKIIPFLAFCLVATCNAELRTWTAVNGKEVEAEFVSNEKGIVKLKLKSGKVFEVPANKLSKEDNEFIRSLAKPEGVNFDEVDRRADKGVNQDEFDNGENPNFTCFIKGSDTPYTGKVFALYENGKKKQEGNLKDGKMAGLWVGWHENGKKAVEGKFKDGTQNGLHVMWYGNEQKEFEANFKDGKYDGLVEAWHKNGQKAMETNFKDGKEISAKYWNSKGEPVDTYQEAQQ